MRALRLLLVAAAALGGPLLVCCSCDGDSPQGGGSGGSTPDAGSDADSSATGGAGGSAGDAEADQEMDGDGWTTTPDAWEPVSWNPPGCQILRANDVTKALPEFGWLDCKNGIAGCVYLDTSRLPGLPNNKGAMLHHAWDVRATPAGTSFALSVIYNKTDDGCALFVPSGPVAAWRSDSVTKCNVNDLVFGEGNLLAVRYSRIVDAGIISAALFGPRDVVVGGGGAHVVVDESVTGNSLAALARVQLTQSTMALEMGVSPYVYSWDYSAAKPKLIPRPPDVQEDYGAIVKGSEIVFVRDGAVASARAFAVRHADGKVENLFQKPSVWAAFLRSDGDWFAWQELSQADGGAVLEAWKSPFATTPAGFKPQKLASVPVAQSFVLAGLAGGWWVYRASSNTLRAVRLADGKHLDVAAPAGFGWINPFGVVDGELWAQIHLVPGTDNNVYSVARLPISALGQPQ